MSALRGREKVKDISKYLEQHKEVNFVVRKYFDCQEYIDNEHVQKLFKALPTPNDPKIPDYILPLFFSLQDNGPLTIQSSETMEILSEPLWDAVVAITGMGHEEVAYLETPRNVKMLQDSIYYFSRLDKGIVPRLTTSQQLQLSSLLEYMQWAHGHAYKEADALISQGLIKREYLAKIFGSNQPLVTNVGGHHRAYMLESPPSSGGPRNSDSIVLRLWCWHFNGKFYKEHEEWTLSWPPSANEDAEIPISGLEIYPLRYAAPHVAKQLKARGETFWKCHKARFVAYDPPNSTLKYHTYIREIDWNNGAFDLLVMQHSKKELIKALITVHAVSAKSTDIIEGKGNALIMLLHGGPGTGKTLTAESVAELTRKPLYRVTCGDIGTNAEEIEKYLDSVLLIGTIWGCVVLLDEADVFLEERRETDLQRNALVSVFLRVLEYYDGILILTSNRVGTFDGAFKSRFQLAIHYPALHVQGRHEIWLNFINGLSKANPNVDLDDIKAHIQELAAVDLNGREIRNMVRTSLQLAQFREETLGYKHFKQVIGVAEEFEKHIAATRGFSYSDWDRSRGIRPD
ncbi:hypothetical protein UA08_07454 [Talaromyces atroroseus]|uniref:AAA+ ATPase domain-containing protein n=1 Tax=Talaromyces atroroseus TaxID=1441469 RepID=A0A225AE70_TALAT|nr:hypothetical protein UA08_07454 [Talaromyces atroroseus]OKL57333.1 hypothetical protein UA08_07454 [Talaromyces atroroseus]